MAERVVAMHAPVMEAVDTPGIPSEQPADTPGEPGAAPPSAPAGGSAVQAERKDGTMGEEGGAAPPDVARLVARPGRGRPLPEPIRVFMEPRFDRDFSSVRIHDGPEDQRAAHRIGARAFTHGHHIWIGAGESAGDRRLLAHELTHVVQQTSPGPARQASKPGNLTSIASARGKVRAELRKQQIQQHPGLRLGRQLPNGAEPRAVLEPPRGALQRDQPKYVIVPVAGTAEPLAAYAGLRDRLSPSDWNALSAAARRRSEQVLTGAPSTEKNELVKTELTVPLDALFEPAITESRASGGDLWLQDLFASAMTGGPSATAAMAQRLQDEILFGWLQENAGILSEAVTIAVVDPGGKGGGATSLLAFTFRGHPVAPVNGLLTLAAVDKVIGGTAEARLASMRWQLMALGEAIERAGKAKAMIAAAHDVAAQKHEKIAAQALDQIDAAMRVGLTELGAVTASPYSELVQPIAAELKAYVDGGFARFRVDHAKWRAANPRSHSDYEEDVGRLKSTLQTHEQLQKSGSYISAGLTFAAAAEHSKYLVEQNLFFGNAPEQERQLGAAYDQGLVSYDSWSKGVEAAQTRGWIFGGINAALTLATFGLGFYFRPLTLGASVAFGVGTGLVTGVGPMLGSNWYTSSTSFADPMVQQWWQSGSYSTKDILVSGLVGAGIGGTFPVAERALGWLRGQGPQAAAIIQAGGALPKGVVATTVERGVVDLAIASENVTIRVTAKGFQIFGPAGGNPRALLQEGVWAAETAGGPGFGLGTRFDLLNPDFPTSLGFGETGWGMVSPKSGLPVQWGFWPELAPTQGGASVQMGAEMSPLLGDALSGGTVWSIVGSENALVLSGAYLPKGTAASQSASTIAPDLPPFSNFFEPPSFRDIGWFLPQVENSSIEQATVTFGKLVEQHGTDVLPYIGKYGIWRKHRTGYAPFFYVTRPEDIPKLTLTTYGTELSNVLFDATGTVKSALVIPGESYLGPMKYPMATKAMTDKASGYVYARSHVIPRAQTKLETAEGTPSASDARNFVAHPVKYNEWIRNQLEQKLKREGLAYTALNIITPKTRWTTGGYMIPESEIFVQYGPNGQAIKAWEFQLSDPDFYDNLQGSFKDVLPQFEIGLNDIPKSLIIK